MPSRPPPTRPYAGWHVVATCFALALFAWGFGFYGHGIFLAELTARRGWPAATISAATSAYYLFGALLLTGLGAAFARAGIRPVLLAAVAAMAAGTLAVPLVAEPWQLFAAYLVMAFGWAGMTSAAIATVLSGWFHARRGLAISLALNGASTGGIVVAPALLLLIGAIGFLPAVALLVALMLAVLVPMVLAFARPPRDGEDAAERARPGRAGRPEAAPLPRLATSLRFWGIAAPFALALMAQVAFLTHQVAILAVHLSPAGAGLAVSLTTAAAVAGRLGLGAVVDRLDVRLAAAASFASQAAALAWLGLGDATPAALYGGCVLFGLSVGNVITLPALIVQRELPAASFGRAVGLATAVGQVTYAFGPGIAGAIRDGDGGDRMALLLCAGLFAAAAAGVLALRPVATPAGSA